MFYFILIVVALVIWTWVKWETISPKLLVRESATIAGAFIGAAPEVARTTVKVAKAANAKTDLELRQAGSEGPVGFRTGKVMAAKATRDVLRDINREADELLAKTLADLEAMKKAQ